MSLKHDTLFILRAPFEDTELEGTWFCTSCATMEGMLLANPHWARSIDVKRVAFPRPRAEVIEVLGEENQSLPALAIADVASAPPDAIMHGAQAFLTDPKAIARYLAAQYGGAGPHP